jgi:hypothetical protein
MSVKNHQMLATMRVDTALDWVKLKIIFMIKSWSKLNPNNASYSLAHKPFLIVSDKD